MGMFDYGGRGTYLNGFLNYVQTKHPSIEIKSLRDLNVYLKAIRLRIEPNKPVSKDVEKNSFYIQEKIDWQKVKEYFNDVELL